MELTRPYALVLEAQIAARRQPDADDLLRQLDSALADPIGVTWTSYGNRIAARLHEERANARRSPRCGGAIPGSPRSRTTSTLHRHEARLAALTGDRDGSIELTGITSRFAARPSPPFSLRCARNRAELEALERQSTDR